MTSKLNLFFTIVVALMLVAVLVLQINSGQLPRAAENSQGEQNPVSEITVTGEATASAPPDVAYVNIGVQTNAATADGAVEDSNATMTAVTNAITGLGVSSQDIQTSTYSISPQYSSPKAQSSSGQTSSAPSSGGQTGGSEGSGGQASSGQTPGGQASSGQTSGGQTSTGQITSEQTPSGQAPQISGYRVTNTVQVTIHDLNKVGQILDQAVQAGANDISGVTFELENPGKLQADALGQAVSDAQNRAAALAESSGVQLGDVINITETPGSNPIPVIASAAQLSNTSVPIQPGLAEVHLQIQVTFAIH